MRQRWDVWEGKREMKTGTEKEKIKNGGRETGTERYRRFKIKSKRRGEKRKVKKRRERKLTTMRPCLSSSVTVIEQEQRL